MKRWRMQQKRQPVPQSQGKKAAQGETLAARRDKGTVKGREGESSRLSDNEPMTVTFEHRASRSADHLVFQGETREGGYGKGAPRRRQPSDRNDSNAGLRAGRRTPRYSREKVKNAEWQEKCL